jgi:hypothetical protein
MTDNGVTKSVFARKARRPSRAERGAHSLNIGEDRAVILERWRSKAERSEGDFGQGRQADEVKTDDTSYQEHLANI